MTVPRLNWRALLKLASDLGCVGVEFRNDLTTPLFGGEDPKWVADEVRATGLRLLGLSQVYPFNSWSDAVRSEVATLIATAQACSAETISLIPRNDGSGTSDGERQSNLQQALREIKPMLADAGMIALIEPLGFARASLRLKREAIEAIAEVGGEAEFRLVHDTFHHFLSGESDLFPDQTGIVHISGVADRSVLAEHLEDEHRVLVDASDRLGNLAQLRGLLEEGYDGTVSFEAFSPKVHAVDDPAEELAASMAFVRSRL